MDNNNKKVFRLIVQMVRGKDFTAGPAAGLGVAYYEHTTKNESNGKVILDINISRRGFGEYKPDEAIWETLMEKPGEFVKYKDSLIKISKTGYIYESKRGITWQFKLEKILNFEEMSKTGKKKYLKYYPTFIRTRWKNEAYFPDGYKPLVSHLKKLKKPISPNDERSNGFIKYSQYSTDKNLFPIIQGGNTFIHRWQKLSKEDFEKESELDSKYFIDQKLKTILEKPPTERGALESTIQDIIERKLIEKGYYFVAEGTTGKKRFDFLFKDKYEKYFAIEVKIGEGAGATKQLFKYISKLEKNLSKYDIPSDEKINGIILCADPSEKTKKEANKYGYDVWTYKLGLKIQDELGKNIF